jgi:hypothetical protein
MSNRKKREICDNVSHILESPKTAGWEALLQDTESKLRKAKEDVKNLEKAKRIFQHNIETCALFPSTQT